MKKLFFGLALIAISAFAAVTWADDPVPAQFPATKAAWDGTSSTRANRGIHREPAAEDWNQITAEVIATQSYLNTVQALGTFSSGTKTINLASGLQSTFTVGGSFTLAFSNPPAAFYKVTLVITNGGAGTITWPTVTWLNDGGVAPTLISSGVDIVTLFSPDAGVTLYGVKSGQLRTTDIGAGVVTPAKWGTLSGIKSYVVVGAAAAGPITTTGTVVGDRIIMAFYATTAGGGLTVITPGTEIEATVTVINQIQQISASNLSTKTLVIWTVPAAS